jgi:diacylglycerol kinase (ATP)
MTAGEPRRVLMLVNKKAGLLWSFHSMRRAMDKWWDIPGTELSYQFCQSRDDGLEKARRAVEDGVDCILAVGGDGTVNTIGSLLVGTEVSLGVIPAGSGNGFARHFEIPLVPEKAVRALAASVVKRIDVGVVDSRPFFVTCSMAWDASVVRSFERSAFRGIIPYIFAGVNEFFEYDPQEVDVDIDSGRRSLHIPDPLVFTVANLTQYGGGAKIAPHARADDGFLELVVARRQDIAVLLANVGRFFDGTIHKIPKVVSLRFKTLKVKRAKGAPIQIDGELVDAPDEVDVRIMPAALKVLVPKKQEEA